MFVVDTAYMYSSVSGARGRRITLVQVPARQSWTWRRWRWSWRMTALRISAAMALWVRNRTVTPSSRRYSSSSSPPFSASRPSLATAWLWYRSESTSNCRQSPTTFCSASRSPTSRSDSYPCRCSPCTRSSATGHSAPSSATPGSRSTTSRATPLFSTYSSSASIATSPSPGLSPIVLNEPPARPALWLVSSTTFHNIFLFFFVMKQRCFDWKDLNWWWIQKLIYNLKYCLEYS